MFFSLSTKYSLGSAITFSCHTSLACFNVEPFYGLFFFFLLALEFLRKTVLLSFFIPFSEIESFSFGAFLMFLHDYIEVTHFSLEFYISDGSFSGYHIQRPTISIFPSLVILILIICKGVVQFSTVFSSPGASKQPPRGTWRPLIELFIIKSPPVFGIHGWFLPDPFLTRMAINDDFPSSTIPSKFTSP